MAIKVGKSFAARITVVLTVAAVVAGVGTGIATPAFAATVPAPISLNSSSCPANIVGGEIDGCVTELQDLLNVQGAGLTVDGDFGNGTLAAVESFQSIHGLQGRCEAISDRRKPGLSRGSALRSPAVHPVRRADAG